jgi:hypothetical protein
MYLFNYEVVVKQIAFIVSFSSNILLLYTTQRIMGIGWYFGKLPYLLINYIQQSMYSRRHKSRIRD